MSKHTFRPNHIAVARMFAMLIDGASVVDMIDETGMTRTTISGYLRALRRENAIYVRRWEPDQAGRMSLRVWAIGNKPNAKKPRPAFDGAERQRLYRSRQRAIAFGQVIAGQAA